MTTENIMEDITDQPGAAGAVPGQTQSMLIANEAAHSHHAGSDAADEQLPPGQWVGTNSNTLSAIERLRATIDDETEKLELRAVVDFDVFSQRKNRGLLELTRAVRATQGEGADPRVMPQLASLRASLVKNQAALQVHLDAVREVSRIIAKSIQESESDGTYSLITSSQVK